MIEYFNYDMCKMCGGACCKNVAGSYIPSDFMEKITVDFIVGLLNTGKVAIDWWEGDVKGRDLGVTYYLRPRHKKEAAIKGSWGGECINFTQEKGCSLTEEQRPYQCRKLIPNFNKETGEPNCITQKKDKASKKDCAIAWYDYQDILHQSTKRYYEIEKTNGEC